MKNASKTTFFWSAGGERDLADRHEHAVELRVLHVLQHDALGALLLHDPLVVRQVERRRLHAAVAVAGREHDVDDADRRERAELRVAVLRIDWQRVLEFLQVRGERLQLLRLRFVADGDERLERGLEVEPLVLVDLVWTDGRLDRRVELHPRDVAGVVVVVEERVGARRQESLERRLRRQFGRLAQERGRTRELALILDAVGNGGEAASRGRDESW